MADDAGSLLVRAGLIDPLLLDRAREESRSRGGTVAEHLVLLGAIDDEELTRFYRNSLLVPRILPSRLAKLTPQTLERLPPDMAIEFRTIPIEADPENNLTVVMSDPSNSSAVDEIAFFSGAFIIRAVATQAQIAWCLDFYYGHRTELYERFVESAKPRDRTDTGQVDSMRHRVRPPVDSEPPEVEITAEPPEPEPPEVEITAEPAEPEPPEIEITAEPAPVAPVVDDELPDEGETQPIEVRARRRPKQEPNPPELAARSGELESRAETNDGDSDLPAVILDYAQLEGDEEDEEDELADAAVPDDAATPEEIADGASEPILLTRRRPSSLEPQPATSPPHGIPVEIEDEEPIVLQPKRERARRQTDLGFEPPRADEPPGRPATPPTQTLRFAVTPETSKPTPAAGTRLPSQRPQAERPRVSTLMPAETQSSTPPGDTAGEGRQTTPETPRAPRTPSPPREPAGRRDPAAPNVPLDGADTEREESPERPRRSTRRHPRAPRPSAVRARAIARKRTPVAGTQPYHPETGARRPGPSRPPGMSMTVTDSGDRDTIPIRVSDEVSGPVTVAKVAAALDSSDRLLVTLDALRTAGSRDEILSAALDHVVTQFERAAFLAVKKDLLVPWIRRPAAKARDLRGADLPLRLNSTLRDVVDARLPFRGTIGDYRSRVTLDTALGVKGGVVLLVPVTLRGKVIGIMAMSGDASPADAQLSAILRAVSDALERNLIERKTGAKK